MFRIIFGALIALTLCTASVAFVSPESISPKEGDIIILSLTGNALKDFEQSLEIHKGNSTADACCVLAKVSRVHLESNRVVVSAFETCSGDLRATSRVIKISGNAPVAALNTLDAKFGNLPSHIAASVPFYDIYGVSHAAGIVPTFVMPISEFQQSDREAIRLQLHAFEEINLSR